MKEIRFAVAFILTLLSLVMLSVAVAMKPGNPNRLCFRVVVRLPVPPHWLVAVHAMAHESSLCKLAEDLTQERTHVD
jgi:hypothetical protein